MLRKLALALLVGVAVLGSSSRAEDSSSFTRKEDVVYGRKFGTALTLDVFTPKKNANGAGVIFAVSGGFFSAHENIRPEFVRPLVDRGYTVFAVVHGSQPRFQVDEITQDMHRAARFIRHHAKDFGIDPERLGVTGGSAGGHLSLMLGTTGGDGNPQAKDPVEQQSSKVQAVACFFPPTDFLNWGTPGHELLRAIDHQSPFRAAFDYRQLDKATNMWERVTDTDKLREINRVISPIYSVSADDAPTLILHGDKDALVPVQQSETFVQKLKSAGVVCKLVVKEGAGHGWPDMLKDLDQFADWFDVHLKKK